MLTLLNLVIMGLLWMREDNIIIKLATNTLIINSYGLIILTKVTPVLLKTKELMAVCNGPQPGLYSRPLAGIYPTPLSM